jgi:hypothetical protein
VGAGPALLAAVAEEAFSQGRGGALNDMARSCRHHRALASHACTPYGVAASVDLGAGLLLSWQRWASGTWTVPAATHAAANLAMTVMR